MPAIVYTDYVFSCPLSLSGRIKGAGLFSSVRCAAQQQVVFRLHLHYCHKPFDLGAHIS